mmetsp:Transcript_63378/g.204283  ORF Transcript_63378/g.204283 Transcript_63378/m.204283 type:complete len:337 (+) Transcript_63378:33-1043(+)
MQVAVSLPCRWSVGALPRCSLCSALVEALRSTDDLRETWLARGSSDQETIHVGQLTQGLAIGRVDGATVENPDRICHLAAANIPYDSPDLEVSFLCLQGCGDNACADGPDRLVRNYHLRPVGYLGHHRFHLLLANLCRLACLTLFQLFADAEHDVEAFLQRHFHFRGAVVVCLAKERATLRVAHHHPLESQVLDHPHRDLTCEGTLSCLADVLHADCDGFGAPQSLCCSGHVDRWREDHSVNDRWVWAKVLECGQELRDVLQQTRGLPIAAYHWLPEHALLWAANSPEVQPGVRAPRAKLLLDAQQLVVLGKPLGAAGCACLDLTGAESHDEVGNE